MSATNRQPRTVRRIVPSPPRMLVPPTMIPVRTVNVRNCPLRLGAQDARRVEGPGERRGGRRSAQGRDPDGVDPHAAEAGGLGVAAGRVDIAAERRPAEQDRRRRWRTRSSSRPRVEIPAILVAANDWKSGWSSATTRLPLVTIAAMPLTTKVIASVPMSGLIRNWVTMTPFARPTARPDREAGEDPHRRPDRDRELRRDRAGQPVDRADREVDAARDEDERPGAGDDDDPGLLVEDVGEVAEAQERRADDGQHHERDEERDEDPRPADEPRRSAASAAAAGDSAARRGLGVMRRSRWPCRTLRPRSPPPSCPARQLGDESAAAHDEHPVGQAQDLLDLVGDEQDRHAVGGEPDEHLVDVALRADIDRRASARRR